MKKCLLLMLLCIAMIIMLTGCNRNKDKNTNLNEDVDIKVDTNIDTETGTKIDVNTETNTGVDTNTKIDVNSNTNTDVDTDTEVDVNTDKKVDVSTNKDANAGTDTIVDVNTNMRIDVNSSINAEEDIGTNVDTDTNTSAGADTDMKVDENTNTAINTDTNKYILTDTNMKVGVNKDTNADADTDTIVDTNKNESVASDTNNDIDTEAKGTPVKRIYTNPNDLENGDNEHTDGFKYNGVDYLYSEQILYQSNDYTYFVLSSDKKEISITRIANAKEHLIIPKEVDGYRVVCLGVPFRNFSAFEENLYEPQSQFSILEKEDINKVTSLTIPEGVRIIGISAFMDMKNLKEVFLPDSLEAIGVEAFAESGIEALVLPKNVKKIELQAFYDCDALKKVTVNSGDIMGSDEYPSFKSCINIEEVIWGDVEYASLELFRLSKINKVVIPSSVKRVELIRCYIGSLIIRGKDTEFVTNKDFNEFLQEGFTVVVPKGSVAIKTLKKLKIRYKIETSSKQ